MKNFLFLIVCTIVLLSCEEDKVRFSEPQPAGIDSDSKIRKAFWGKYLNLEDSSYLVVNEESVRFQAFNIDTKLDSVKISGGSKNIDINLSARDSASRLKISLGKEEDSDTVNFQAVAEDEFFNLKKGGIAKFHKGYYFLNIPFTEGQGFRVRIMQRTKEGVILSRIASDSVLHLLEKEEFVKKGAKGNDDEEEWKLNPTRKQLKKMMKMGLFSEVQSFKRQD